MDRTGRRFSRKPAAEAMPGAVEALFFWRSPRARRSGFGPVLDNRQAPDRRAALKCSLAHAGTERSSRLCSRVLSQQFFVFVFPGVALDEQAHPTLRVKLFHTILH